MLSASLADAQLVPAPIDRLLFLQILTLLASTHRATPTKRPQRLQPETPDLTARATQRGADGLDWRL